MWRLYCFRARHFKHHRYNRVQMLTWPIAFFSITMEHFWPWTPRWPTEILSHTFICPPSVSNWKKRKKEKKTHTHLPLQHFDLSKLKRPAHSSAILFIERYSYNYGDIFVISRIIEEHSLVKRVAQTHRANRLY